MTPSGPPRLRLERLTKSFGGMRALDDAHLEVRTGEVHGLLGKNGSGKSTLIKILSGFHAPDEGLLEVDGRPVEMPVPLGRGADHGLAFVHQNLGLLTEATVLENLIAGDRGRSRPWFIDWRAEAARAERLFSEHHLDLRPATPVADLSPVARAQLAIVRAADRVAARGGGGVLILDEPTPFLPSEDVRALFALLRRLTERGTGIVFVSHDVDEVMDITDRATVLRDGRVIATFETPTTSREEIVGAIVGGAVASGRAVRAPASAGRPGARVAGLSGRTLSNASFEVAAGEVLGLTGLIGSGYDEVPNLLGGAAPGRGTLVVGGHEVAIPGLTPAAAIRHGIVLIPADRQRCGIAPDLTLTENAMLPRRGHGAWLNHRRRRKDTVELMRRFTVKADRPSQAAAELSGGNQQKLLLGKWFQLDPRLVCLDEPTQGIDIGARREIFDRIAELCDRGVSVICASSEAEQLETIAHRVLVFDRGRITGELRGADVTKSAISAACYDGGPLHAAV